MKDVSTSIQSIESTIDDPRNGLPEAMFLFVSRLTPLINVDLLVQDDRGSTLLTWRDDEAFGRGWHIPGGIIRYKEPIAERISLCALDELGASVVPERVPVLVSETIRESDTRGHFISLLFRCRLTSPLDDRRAAADPPAPGAWRWHDRCPPDLLDVQRPYASYFNQ